MLVSNGWRVSLVKDWNPAFIGRSRIKSQRPFIDTTFEVPRRRRLSRCMYWLQEVLLPGRLSVQLLEPTGPVQVPECIERMASRRSLGEFR